MPVCAKSPINHEPYTCVIAGASGTLGRAIYQHYLQADPACHLLLLAHRHGASLEAEVASLPKSEQARCRVLASPLTLGDDFSQQWTSLLASFPTIRQGIYAAGQAHYALIQDLDPLAWKELEEANLSSAIAFAQTLRPYLIHQDGAALLFLTSIWGRTGAAGEAAYSALKAAVMRLAEALAQEWGPSGVRVNSVAPGFIESKMNAHFSSEEIEAFVQDLPISRLGQAEEVAALVYWLQSDAASYITGQVIGIDGGYVL